MMPGLLREAVMDAVTTVPPPANEPIRQYPPGSPDRAALEGKVLPGDHLRVDRDGPKGAMRFERSNAKQPAAAARI